MADKKDLELIASSAKAMARHFRAFMMAEEIADTVINSESRLSELETALVEAEKKLKLLEKEVVTADASLKHAKEKNGIAISEAEARTASRIKEIEAKVQSAEEAAKKKIADLATSHEGTMKDMEIQIQTKKMAISALVSEHEKLMMQYAKEESEAANKVKLAKAEIEKARNMLK
jgi:peptidoglycan hydrolase CwlO-like protein